MRAKLDVRENGMAAFALFDKTNELRVSLAGCGETISAWVIEPFLRPVPPVAIVVGEGLAPSRLSLHGSPQGAYTTRQRNVLEIRCGDAHLGGFSATC